MAETGNVRKFIKRQSEAERVANAINGLSPFESDLKMAIAGVQATIVWTEEYL